MLTFSPCLLKQVVQQKKIIKNLVSKNQIHLSETDGIAQLGYELG